MKVNGFYKFWRGLLRPIFKLFFFLKIIKPKDERPDRGLIVCSNHVSATDPLFLALGLKRQAWFLAKEQLAKAPVLKHLIRRFAIPIKRGSADLVAMRASIERTSAGGALIMFPQGTRMPEKVPKETEVKSGVGMIAARSGCDVLPAYIFTKNYRVRPFRKIKVIYGEPIKYEDFGFDKKNKTEIDSAAALIWEKICALAPDDQDQNV